MQRFLSFLYGNYVSSWQTFDLRWVHHVSCIHRAVSRRWTLPSNLSSYNLRTLINSFRRSETVGLGPCHCHHTNVSNKRLFIIVHFVGLRWISWHWSQFWGNEGRFRPRSSTATILEALYYSAFDISYPTIPQKLLFSFKCYLSLIKLFQK